MPEARQRKCGRCKGRGAIPDLAFGEIKCPNCNGKGWVRMFD